MSLSVRTRLHPSFDDALAWLYFFHSGTSELSALLPFQGFTIDFRRAATAKYMVDASAAVAMGLGLLARAKRLDAAE